VGTADLLALGVNDTTSLSADPQLGPLSARQPISGKSELQVHVASIWATKHSMAPKAKSVDQRLAQRRDLGRSCPVDNSANAAGSSPPAMQASEFKARCLAVLDDVARTRREVVVTKHGIPVARRIPIAERAPTDHSVMLLEKATNCTSRPGESWDADR